MYSQNCDVHSHDTRKKSNLHVAIGHSDLYAKSFYCTSIIIWNNIMNKINIAVSFPKFKKLLTLQYLKYVIYSIIFFSFILFFSFLFSLSFVFKLLICAQLKSIQCRKFVSYTLYNFCESVYKYIC